jgi:hypothetical protein
MQFEASGRANLASDSISGDGIGGLQHHCWLVCRFSSFISLNTFLVPERLFTENENDEITAQIVTGKRPSGPALSPTVVHYFSVPRTRIGQTFSPKIFVFFFMNSIKK